ncbi:MAG: peptidylprolyl isomerase, partial [Candidatus Brocadiia bacterium]|nr:peptidylprolyl isomerase [Candidatus Brocadiia bacterium]
DRTHGKRFAAAHIAVPDEEFARQLLGLLRVQPQRWPDLVLHVSLDRASIPSIGRLQPVPASSELGKVLAGMEASSIRLYEEKGPVLRPGKPAGGQFQSDASRWHILYLIRPIHASDRPFQEVKDELRRELYCRRAGEIIDGWLARLHARATVVVNLSLEPRARAVLHSDIVAFVNGEPIRTEAFGSTLVKEFGRDFIGPYVDRYLVFQKTSGMGIEVPQEALEESLAEATEMVFAEHATNYGMALEEFEEFLGKSGLSPSNYRVQLARYLIPVEDIRAELLARQVLADDVTVTEEDLQRAHSERDSERIDARRIVLDDLPTANAVLADAQRGADFGLLVRTKSVAPLAWMHRGLVRNITSLHPYYQRVKGLPVGQVTGPFESNGKHVILKVIARHSASDPPPIAEVRAALVEEVRAEKIRALTAAWIEVLRAESKIEIEL